jgi:hypothetical protein
LFSNTKNKIKTYRFVYLCRLFSTLTIFSRETMSNWYDPDHLSEGKVRDISIHEENPDDWDCEIELNCHKTENSGRVSTVFMRYLRDKYGENTADRALKRAQKREQRARTEDTPTTPTTSTKMAGVF